MTKDSERQSMPYQDWKEFKEAADGQFRSKEITENEYRIKLAALGLNATEINEEVKGIEDELE